MYVHEKNKIVLCITRIWWTSTILWIPILISSFGVNTSILPSGLKSDTLEGALRANQELFIADAQISSKDHVIDLDCGIGTLSFLIAETVGCQVTGINLSQYQLKIANRMKKKLKIKNVDFIEMDIMNMQGIQDQYDAVFLIDVGVHFPDKKKGLTNIFTFLKDDSRLIIADWLQKDKSSNSEQMIFLEPFCQYWAFPYMISLPQYKQILTNVRFTVEKAADVSDDVKQNWKMFYDQTIQIVTTLSLSKMLKSIKNPKLILQQRTKLFEAFKAQAYANIFTKVCSDAGVFRYGYIIAKKWQWFFR